MRRWILKPGTTSLDGLALEDAPMPEPRPGEVRIKMHAASINYRDQIILGAQFGMKITEDLIPLSDGAGEIDALGSGVEKWSVGDRVTSVYVENWVDGPAPVGMGFGLGAPGSHGVLAEYIILSAERVTRAPQSLTFVEASTLPCAGLTAWSALNGNHPYRGKRVAKGDKVLVLGTGGVSLFALLLARSVGAEVIGTSSQDEKLERMRVLGAIDGVNYRATPEWGEEIFKRLGGADMVVNAAGSAAMDQSIAALAPGGEIALMGLFSYAETPPNFISLMTKTATIRGTAVGGLNAYRDLIDAIDTHRIKPPVYQVFKFEEAKEAYKAAVSPALFGKIVVEIAPG